MGGVAMSEWRKIGSAPKDGRRVLLFVPTHDEPITVGEYHRVRERDESGRFSAGGGWAYWMAMDSDYLSSYCKPTHWMPLPKEPR